MKNYDEFEKMALEMGGEIIKLTPSTKECLNVFEINNGKNKYQKDFELAIRLNPINTRESLILNYGIEQGKIESNKDFNKLLKAILEAYPKSTAEYVDYDIYCRELMNKFINSTTN